MARLANARRRDLRSVFHIEALARGGPLVCARHHRGRRRARGGGVPARRARVGPALGLERRPRPHRRRDVPAGYIVDIVFAVLLLAWVAGVWFVVTGVRRQTESTSDEDAVPVSGDDGELDAEVDGEPEEPWYRQGPPIFDEPFSDEYPRVVVPPDETASDDGPQDSLWQPDTMAAGADEPPGMFRPGALGEDMVSDAEIMGGTRASDPDEPPMIVPVRAYYFTRPEDTLRSISAQFLQTPKRWQELRSLNAASPGVAAVGPDTLLPEGTALALPGDPLPWASPTPSTCGRWPRSSCSPRGAGNRRPRRSSRSGGA